MSATAIRSDEVVDFILEHLLFPPTEAKKIDHRVRHALFFYVYFLPARKLYLSSDECICLFFKVMFKSLIT